MFKRLSHFFPVIIAGFLALSTYWLEFVVSNERPSGRPSNVLAPDAFVDQLELDRFDAHGRHQSHLTAEKMTHYGDSDTADLVQPRLLFSRDQRTLHVRSDRGHGINNTREIQLDGNVIGIRKIDNDPREQRLLTESLSVLTEDEIATTSAPVTMTQGATTIEGVGAEWNNADGTLKMHQVEATLQGPAKRKP